MCMAKPADLEVVDVQIINLSNNPSVDLKNSIRRMFKRLHRGHRRHQQQYIPQAQLTAVEVGIDI